VAVLDDVQPYDESNNVISLDHVPLHRQGRTFIAPEPSNMMPTRALVPRVLDPTSAKRQRLSGPAASSSSRVSPRRAARSDDRSFQHVDHAVLQLWPFPTFYEDNDVEQSDAVNQHSQL
jgi:hypothetical protein